eukprot:SM000025S08469  [mRNA]  locus=s25:1064635:1065013:- [translate_table: standard]
MKVITTAIFSGSKQAAFEQPAASTAERTGQALYRMWARRGRRRLPLGKHTADAGPPSLNMCDIFVQY